MTLRSRVAQDAVHAVVNAVEAPDDLLLAVRGCRACATQLPLGPRPLLQAGGSARILIVGQAPGTRAHASGIPWSDRSGERLREWMGIDAHRFYDRSCVAIVPMGLCYPGRAASGELPPRRECAPLWLDRLLAQPPRIQLTLLVGAYAQAHFLRSAGHASVTATMRDWRTHLPRVVPLPHPSPRNIEELLPVLQRSVRELVDGQAFGGRPVAI